MLRALSLAAYARTAALASSPASGSAGVHTQAVTAAAPEGGNCSDPKLYPRNPFTHKAHPCADFCAGANILVAGKRSRSVDTPNSLEHWRFKE